MASILTFSCLLSLFFFFPIFSSSQSTFTCSRATYYGSPDCSGTPRGACGYGELGRSLNGGDVGAVSRLYRNGTGCGACYQVRCTHPQFCNEDGAKIVVTDYGQGDNTDFILSARGFVKLARSNMANELMAFGVIDVEYRRIPCQYPGYNMMVKVTEHSKFPDYLALIIIYQAGQKDILAVELWQEECQEWKGMRKAYGGVWDMANPPRGPMNARILTGDDSGQNWVQLNGVIPSGWKAGVAYDTAIQLD
ncbi:expansin-like B1 [Elaeis guineensis]|uniref:Expansin-like B1 n=1 Tax=Elaeis guineensis var. tenera TaxID=51953 RepID=A0A6I9S535_ELAGV|nr:expansin-like B1 [Elaeis guineensis]